MLCANVRIMITKKHQQNAGFRRVAKVASMAQGRNGRGGKREFGGGWLPNRVRKFFRTLTVKNPPARARAKQNTSNKAGVFYAKLCIIHK